MKNNLFISVVFSLILLFGSLATNAQYRGGQAPVSPMGIGTTLINVGVGLGATYRDDINHTSFGTKIAGERGIWQAGPGVIALGGELGGSFASGDYYNNFDNARVSTFILAARASWHYGWDVPGLDTYGGFSLGAAFHHYHYERENESDYNHNESFPVFGAYVGASYFLTPMFGFNAEAGYDITNFQVGVVFKLQ